MKRAYVTILSSENFKTGVEVLYKSLRCYSNEEFLVVVNSDISENSIESLRSKGMTLLRLPDIELSNVTLSSEQQTERWYKTLFKLRIFGLEQYEKLVYLDSDMLICGEIDDLFNKANFSAVPDMEFMPSYGREGLNAGVICFSPSRQIERELVDKIPLTAAQYEVFGDQDVINMWLKQWDNQMDKHLDVSYNSCFYSLDEYSGVKPKIVHFILQDKPWMWGEIGFLCKKIKWMLTGKKCRIKYSNMYFDTLRNT